MNYIEKQLPRNENQIIDDIYDIDIYNKLIKMFPQIKLIAFYSKYSDCLNRLSIRAGITNKKDIEYAKKLFYNEIKKSNYLHCRI